MTFTRLKTRSKNVDQTPAQIIEDLKVELQEEQSRNLKPFQDDVNKKTALLQSLEEKSQSKTYAITCQTMEKTLRTLYNIQSFISYLEKH